MFRKFKTSTSSTASSGGGVDVDFINTTEIHASRSWQVRMPPFKKHMVGGHLVPTLRRFLREKPRKISIEVRGPLADGGGASNSQPNSPKRSTTPSLQSHPSDDDDDESILSAALEESNALNDKEMVLIRLFVPSKDGRGDDADDHETEGSEDGADGISADAASTASSLGDDQLWKPQKAYKLDEVHVLKKSGCVCEMSLGTGHDLVVRDVRFKSNEDASSFQAALQLMDQLMKERAQRQIALYNERRDKASTSATTTTTTSTTATTATTATAGTATDATTTTPPTEESIATATTTIPTTTTSTAVATPAAATPVVAIPAAATPVVATPAAAAPVVATPTAATPVVTTPAVAIPAVASSSTKVEEQPSKSVASVTLPESKSVDTPESDGTINILIEIVSAVGLCVADLFSTDAYVKVHMGGKEVHRTKHVWKDLNPIWTIGTGSLFLITFQSKEDAIQQLGAGGLSFTVEDYDALGKHDVLGRVTVSLDELLKGKGERTGYKLEPTGKKCLDVGNGMLYLRFKTASKEDKHFIQMYQSYKEGSGMHLDETYVPMRYPKSKFFKAQRKLRSDGEKLLRVKPFPDPLRKEQAKWMTTAEIEAESIKDSTNWIEAGSGDNGKVFLELIGCDGLPNMDAPSINIYNKTDTFACIVFEDCIVNTDVINDSLSPRWLPWTQRAFVFNISRPSSDIFIGIFDYDAEKSPTQLLAKVANVLHDRIGRLRINLSMFLPNTTYDLIYPLYFGDAKQSRMKQQGTVHLRLRIACDNIRGAFLSELMPLEQNYVSVNRKTDFQNTHYTIHGAENKSKFSMVLLTRYLEELSSYQSLLDNVIEALLIVWLWRRHFKCSFKGKEFCLPLHSMTAYIWGILVTWNFNYLPAFLLFSIGWFMLACKEYANKNPLRWHHSPGYFQLLTLFLFDSVSPETVPSNERISELEVYIKDKAAAEEMKRRWAEHDKEAKKLVDEAISDELEQAASEDVDITSDGGSLIKSATAALNPLSPILYPIQKGLQQAVEILRIVQTIFLWEAAYQSFWITTLAFAGSLIVMFVPWGFLITWSLRIAVWVLLGPWMAYVDKYIFMSVRYRSEQSSEALQERWRAQYSTVVQDALLSRIRREHAIKLKSMMRVCFGKYLMSVPSFNSEYSWDKPLPQSSAVPYKGGPIDIVDKKFGQKLTGDMVMARQVQVVEKVKKEASTPKKKQRFGDILRKRSKAPEQQPLLPKTEGSESKQYQSTAISKDEKVATLKDEE